MSGFVKVGGWLGEWVVARVGVGSVHSVVGWVSWVGWCSIDSLHDGTGVGFN